MAYQITKKSSFFLKVIRKLKLYKLRLIPEILIRSIKFDNLRVFYRYKNHSFFTHPLFERVYDYPPLNYSTKKKAEIFHWYHSVDNDFNYNNKFVIEPIDHPLSIMRNFEPFDGLKNQEKIFEIYNLKSCKRIILSSKGQYDLFIKYFPSLKDKISLIYPPIVPKKLSAKKEDNSIIYLLIASDYKKKATDLVIQAWAKADNKISKLILVCPNLPIEVKEKINKDVTIEHYTFVSEAKKEEFYRNSDIALIPMHTDGTAVFVEAIEYGLPIIAMRSQHSSNFTERGMGLQIEVPFYFYDFEYYGKKWRTWDEFFEIIEQSKNRGEFNFVIDEFKRLFRYFEKNQKEIKKMKNKILKKRDTEFSYEIRNKQLLEIYKSCNNKN